jgi:hypothetical protein
MEEHKYILVFYNGQKSLMEELKSEILKKNDIS